ncbi:prolyl oligopeptidase family serine peptidase [Nocardiopsis suaedae]|uniref:prolyl oligopeptidase n=1 Tax=Nocardiopsis suaedae TaxID=3018444 RepID=A0ABT4TLV4_9ACTN|nr:prolyl oligopeptidase family serine peptidase [Nocardiopsis suaedae]MDA2805356.1 prolyl oligopeptidase family serine peptidase [Nocardiopsis suaedae]
MPDLRYPPAERQDLVDELHGTRVADPYRWLEDAGSARTKEWSAAQDALFAAAARGFTGQERFAADIRALLSAGYTGPPVWRGGRSFFVRRASDAEHGVLVTSAPGEEERVLVDPNALDPAGTTTLDYWRPDREGSLLAYQVSEGGDEEPLLRVMDVATGAVVDGPIDRCRYSPVAWLPGGEAFYYVRRLPPEQVPEEERQYHRRVYLHRVGTPADSDTAVFGAGRGMTEYFGVAVGRDGHHLVLTASEGTSASNDAWIADLREGPLEAPRLRPVQEGVDAEASPHVGRDGRLYLFTDRDSPRGRLCVCDPAAPGAENWRTLIGPDPEAVLDDYAVLDGPELERPQVVASWRRHAISEVTRHDLATGEPLETVALPGLGSVGGLMDRPEGGHEVWFTYTDHTTPVEVHRLDARTGRLERWASAPGADGLDLPPVRTEQQVAVSRDGTPVRMLVVRADDGDDRPRPAVLYGYGGFSISMTPGYSATILAWVRAGGAYAVANLRGGLEEGEEWHRAGMLGSKQNVFDDCVAAAEHLVSSGTARADGLAVMGGSNGGLLVGAAVTQRPDLFAAAVSSAPLLDMVRYERFGLGRLWSVEYGSADVPEELEWLLAYSPYHRVREGVRYPATLFTVFDNDTRVDPLHARKMCAALQHATAAPPEERPVLIRREAQVGHSARSVSRSVALSAHQLAFLARYTGMGAGTTSGDARG